MSQHRWEKSSRLNQVAKYLLLLGVLMGLVWGGNLLTQPVQAGSILPPRATPTPEKEGKSKGDKHPAGAYIELQVSGVVGTWAVVEWQDSSGGWHEVEGWRGSLPGSSRWWVHNKDFGQGLFRWVVKQGPQGPVEGLSQPFTLPVRPNETVQVVVVKA